MATRSLSDLRTRVRERVGLPSTSDPSDTTLDRWINDCLARYWAELATQAENDRDTTSVAFVVASDVACNPSTGVALDCSSWLLLRDVELTVCGYTIHPSMTALGDRSSGYLGLPLIERTRCKLIGSALRFDPSGSVDGATGVAWYVPEFTALTGAATITDRNEWTGVAVLEVAVRCRKLHRLDASDIEAELIELRQHIATVSKRHSFAAPTVVVRDGW